MAGSYEHLKRDENAPYGGVDTRLIENMGDAIEAMVHMYWMIQILAPDAAAIRRASAKAVKIECQRIPYPSPFPTSEHTP